MRTASQFEALSPTHSVWVSANAGTGKTKVLTDRVLRLLLSGTPPSRILCITYTTAAAAEMANRIHKELGGWAMADDKALAPSLASLIGEEAKEAHLRRARTLFARVLDDPEGIRIQTIHSFCQSLLKRFPLEADTPPHFTVIDERTAKELLAEARIRLFSGQYAQEDEKLKEAVKYLARLLPENQFSALLNSLVQSRKEFEKAVSNPLGHAGIIANIYASLNVDRNVSFGQALRACFEYAEDEVAQLRKNISFLAEHKPDFCRGIMEWLDVPPLVREQAWSAYRDLFYTTSDTPRVIKSQIVPVALERKYPGLIDCLTREQDRVVKADRVHNSYRIVEASSHLVIIGKALLTLYGDLKRTRAFLDYDDLIIKARTLLYKPGISPWVLYKLDGGIDHLLVDEAQDTSAEQWQLIEALVTDFFAGQSSRSLERTLFVVGDEKQSIYSFQGAAPKAFYQKREEFSVRARSAEKGFRNIKLDRSFRSTPVILRAVDTVFPLERHDAHRQGAGRVEIWPLVEAEESDTNADVHALTHYQSILQPANRLAHKMAGVIQVWLKQGRLLPSKGRPVEPGDIMVLVRRRNEFVHYLSRRLKKLGIPVAGADRLTLVDNIAVMDLLVLAEFLLFPQDDLTLATLLKTPFIGLSEDELFELAYGRKDESLWQRLLASFHEPAKKTLLYLLSKADYVAPYELFAEVLEVMGGRKKIQARLGDEVNDPLNELLTQALAFERTHTPSLQSFIHWIRQGDSEIKRDMEQGRNEVRIMTVHGAKGLQAPIVFLPDTTRMPEVRGPNILWDDRAFYFVPYRKMDVPVTAALRGHKEREEEEEYNRLLYVAMTRAEDELYVCGYKGEKKEEEGSWYHTLSERLKPIMEIVEDGWKLEETQQEAVAAPAKKQKAGKAPLPSFALAKAPAITPLSKPLIPSRAEDGPPSSVAGNGENAALRGKLAHKLLEVLPSLSPDQRPQATRDYLAKYGKGHEPLEQAVLAIMNDKQYAALFAPGSLAEVPIAGIIRDEDGNSRVVSGQIDRLCIEEKRVLVLDYKSSRTVPPDASHIPKAYLRQMAAYKALLSRIYPAHEIECALLWVEGPMLMPVPENILPLLDSVAPNT